MANKFQSGISFRTINDFLSYLPEHELPIVENLRNIILDTLPQCHEQLSYNVPFYSINKRICFIWPGAIPWGNITEGVLLGFNYGHLLGHHHSLNMEGRKNVAHLRYNGLHEIDPSLIIHLLLESEQFDKVT